MAEQPETTTPYPFGTDTFLLYGSPHPGPDAHQLYLGDGIMAVASRGAFTTTLAFRGPREVSVEVLEGGRLPVRPVENAWSMYELPTDRRYVVKVGGARRLVVESPRVHAFFLGEGQEGAL